MGKYIRISVPKQIAPNREDGHPCILTMGDPSPQACPFRSLAHKQTNEEEQNLNNKITLNK